MTKRRRSHYLEKLYKTRVFKKKKTGRGTKNVTQNFVTGENLKKLKNEERKAYEKKSWLYGAKNVTGAIL